MRLRSWRVSVREKGLRDEWIRDHERAWSSGLVYLVREADQVYVPEAHAAAYVMMAYKYVVQSVSATGIMRHISVSAPQRSPMR